MKIRATAYYNFGKCGLPKLAERPVICGGFLICGFEHQSTLNPNMPYRFYLYLASEYSKMSTDDLLYSNKLQMLDTPHFVVFYNGTDPLPEYSTLKLSSAYRNKEETPQLELQVQVININLGFNSELMDACQILKEYAQFVAEVREQAKVYPNRQAIVQAVDVCIRRDIFEGILLENKKEVIDMVFFEYDAEAEKRVIYKDGKEDGKEDFLGKISLCKRGAIPSSPPLCNENFQRNLKMNLSKAQKLCKRDH